MPNSGATPEIHADMLELKGEQRLMNQRLEGSISAMSSSLTALQADMQGVKARVEQLAAAQADFTHHSTAVDRTNKTLEKFIEATDRRWMAHEAENRLVADAVTSHKTGIKVTWLAFGVVWVLVGILATVQFQRINERMSDHLNNGIETKRAYEQRFLRNEQDIRQMQEQRGVIRSP